MTMNRQANKNDLMPLLKRVLGIMLREYKAQFCLVVALILGAALATLRGTLFMRDLVDEYIKPMIGAETPDFGPLAHALLSLALVYLIGLLCSYGYNRIMAVISQGTLKKIRIQLFTKMESLPIKYFDPHPVKRTAKKYKDFSQYGRYAVLWQLEIRVAAGRAT